MWARCSSAWSGAWRGTFAGAGCFTSHAATRAGAQHRADREALLRYVLRPPVVQERAEQRPDGLVRITLKKAYADGTIAVDMDPLRPDLAAGYRPWAELLARTFGVDVLACPTCQGRMKLLALVKDPASIARCLATAGEATEVPRRSPGRGLPYWKSRVLRWQVLGEEDERGGRGRGGRRGSVAAGAIAWVGLRGGAVCGGAGSARRSTPRAGASERAGVRSGARRSGMAAREDAG